MSPIQCFFLEPTGRERRFLRRYVRGENEHCAVADHGYHEARVPIEDGPQDITPEGYRRSPDADAEPYRSDPRWPTHCPCGRPFEAGDVRQVATDAIYRRADTGEERPLREWGPGAMWYADWMIHGETERGAHRFLGPDGHCLVVRCPPEPGHDWCVDGPASGGGGWTRTGTPPRVTATPSIVVGGGAGGHLYHGWLRDGWLVDA